MTFEQTEPEALLGARRLLVVAAPASEPDRFESESESDGTLPDLGMDLPCLLASDRSTASLAAESQEDSIENPEPAPLQGRVELRLLPRARLLLLAKHLVSGSGRSARSLSVLVEARFDRGMQDLKLGLDADLSAGFRDMRPKILDRFIERRRWGLRLVKLEPIDMVPATVATDRDGIGVAWAPPSKVGLYHAVAGFLLVPLASRRNRDFGIAARLGQANVRDLQAIGDIPHWLGPDEVVEFLPGERARHPRASSGSYGLSACGLILSLRPDPFVLIVVARRSCQGRALRAPVRACP